MSRIFRKSSRFSDHLNLLSIEEHTSVLMGVKNTASCTVQNQFHQNAHDMLNLIFIITRDPTQKYSYVRTYLRLEPNCSKKCKRKINI